MLVSSSLFALKLVAGILSNSMAMFASALDSAFDFLSSSVNYSAIRHAQKPADHAHRYGHGKAEALAGFVQSLVIFASSLFLAYKSVMRMIEPDEIGMVTEGVIIMLISIALTWVLVLYQKMVHKKSGSIVIAADRLHYVTDILANGVVIISLLVDKYLKIPYIDAIAALAIALFIFKSSATIFRQSFDVLMDKDISDLYREDLKKIISESGREILGYHDLRSRSAGDVVFLEFHLEVPKELSVKESHDIVEHTMKLMKKKHPNVDMIIHTDPAEYGLDGRVHIMDTEKPRFY